MPTSLIVCKTRLFPVRRVPKALPYGRPGSRTITLGNYTHILVTEWLKVLQSNEVTFLVGGRTVKERVTRNKDERTHLTCIQYQLYRGGMVPVNAWGAIG